MAVTSGTLALGGGSLLATNLAVTTGGQFALNSGTLTVATASLSNGADFVVGTGRAAANFTVLAGGTAWLQQGLLVSSNATLAGAGAVTVGSGAVTVGSGASLAPTGPGNAPANLTVNGTLLLASGGQYLFNVADFTGPTPGVNWDLLTVNGLLSNAATALAPFAIDVLPIGGANFNRDGNYSLTLATATSGLSALNLSAFNLVLTNLPANDGIWSLVTSGTSLVLNYEGITNYVWQNTSGQFSTAGQWANGNAPVLNTTNIVLTFGGTASQAYTATNDLAGLTAKRIVLTNSATVAKYITGNAITLAGVAPELQQNGTGGFVISNNLVLASNLTVAGTNTGTVELDGTISGTASLTKTGSDALVLGGSNTYSGSTLINQGQLVVANGNALRNSTVSNMVNGGLTFSNLTAANVQWRVERQRLADQERHRDGNLDRRQHLHRRHLGQRRGVDGDRHAGEHEPDRDRRAVQLGQPRRADQCGGGDSDQRRDGESGHGRHPGCADRHRERDGQLQHAPGRVQ